MLAGGSISWTIQIEKSLSLSPNKLLIWIKRLLFKFLGNEQIPTLYMDNASSVKLAKKPEYHKGSQHKEVRHLGV